MATNSKRSNRLGNLSLTVYANSALVQGTYPVRLGEGNNRFFVEGLPTEENYDENSLFIPFFDGAGKVTIGTANYREANLTPDAMLEAAVNNKVTVRFGTDPQEELTGTLLSGDRTTALLRLKGGEVREVRNVTGYKYTKVAAGLSNTPSLSVDVHADAAGDYQVTLVYRARNLGWNAQHHWVYDEKAGTIKWNGVVFVQNHSGADFPNAAIKVAAGDFNEGVQDYVVRAQGAPMLAAMESAPRGGAVRSKAVRNVTAESAGVGKIFPLPGRNDVNQGDKQRIEFFDVEGVPVGRENRVRAAYYWHNARRQEASVDTILIVTNTAENKLGTAIPTGNLSVKVLDSTGTFVGAGNAILQELAAGEDGRVQIGSDFDLKAVRIVENVDRQEELLPRKKARNPQAPSPAPTGTPSLTAMPLTAPRTEEPLEPQQKKVTFTKSCAVELSNAKDHPVEFILEEQTNDNLELRGEHGFTQTVAGQHERRVSLAAGEKTTVRYTIVQTQIETVQ